MPTQVVEFEPTLKCQLVASKKTNYHTIDIASKEQNNRSNDRPIGNSSISNVLWNFLNLTVGIGILSLPYAISNTGLIACFFLLILFGIICGYTLHILVVSAQKVNVYNYEALPQYCFGSKGYIITSSFIFIMVFGGLITELIAIGDASFKILQLWGYHSTMDRQIIMMIISSLVVLPLCLFRDLSSLEKVSALKIASITFIVVIVVYYWYSFDGSPIDMNTVSVFNVNGLPSTLGIIAFSFICHDCTFLLYNTLQNPTLQRWQTVNAFGISGTILFNILFAVPAFLSFGSECEPNVINNYPIDDALFIAVRVVIVIVMALSYPPAFYMLRHIIYESVQKAHDLFVYSLCRIKLKSIMIPHSNVTHLRMHYTIHNAPLSHHLATTLIIFGTNLGIALFVSNLGTAMALLGSVAAMNLELVIPALCFIKISLNDKELFDADIWNEVSLCKRMWMVLKQLWFPLVLVVIGSIMSVTGALSSINVM